MKAVTKFATNLAMAVLLVSGFAAKSHATTADSFVMGRLIEANCNSITGLADVALAVYNEQSDSMVVLKINLVNASLCTANPQIFGQRLTDIAFNSVLGAGTDGKEYARLHTVTYNSLGIGNNLTEVVVDGKKLSNVYKKMNLLDYHNYPVKDQRVMPSEGSHRQAARAQQVVEMSRQP